jgi:hypothetical protein
MARFFSSIFGKISGKHGTAIAAIRKDGTCILKVYTPPSNPNTEKQKNQRGKFGFAMKELNCMRKLFNETYGGQYGISKVVSFAMKHCISGDNNGFSMDYSKLLISNGSIDSPANVHIIKLNASKIRLVWDTTLFTQSKVDDNTNLVLLNKTHKHLDYRQNIGFRRNGNAEIELLKYLPDSETHLWLFYTSHDNKKYSKSIYIGMIQIDSLSLP